VSSLNLRRDAIPLTLAVSGWLVLIITVASGPNIIRSVAVFAFVLFGPGVAVVRLLPIRDLLERAVLALAVGMSISLLVAEAADIRHILQPTPVLVILAVICSAAAVTELARQDKRSEPAREGKR
jgi:uncharacterized membrane protein